MSEPNNKFSINPSVLYRDLKDAAAMFWAALTGKYPVPVRSLIWSGLFMFYFILPFDLMPEMVFLLLGFSDDLLLLVYVLNKIRPDIDKYRAFRDKKNRKTHREIKNEKTV